MNLGSIISACMLLVSVAGPGVPPIHGQSSEGRFPLTASATAAALQAAGLSVTPEQVDVPGFMTASTIAPTLRLRGVDLLPDGRLRVRLACEQAKECVPFLATVRGVEQPSSIAAMYEAAVRAEASTSRGALLQAGQHTTLLIQSNHMVISLPVIAIDSGRPGTDVRVSSLDRKQTFRGVVTDEQTVRGSLP